MQIVHRQPPPAVPPGRESKFLPEFLTLPKAYKIPLLSYPSQKQTIRLNIHKCFQKHPNPYLKCQPCQFLCSALKLYHSDSDLLFQNG